MYEVIGLLGSLLFAVCSWPLAYDSFKRRTAAGIQWSFVIIWFLAAVFSAVYAIGVQKYVLLPNYISGGLGILGVLYVKVRETLKGTPHGN